MMFRTLLINDSKDREYTEANINFIVEEIVVAHIMREKLVDLPRTLVRNDSWRLIAYPGTPLASDIYQWQKKALPHHDSTNPYAGAQYDLAAQHLVVFDDTH